MIIRAQDTEELDESEVVLPVSYNASNPAKTKHGIDIYDPVTWPINSEIASIARKEFIRDGFRRLYARGRENTSANPFRPAVAMEMENVDSELGAAIRELGGLLGRQENNGRTSADDDDTSDASDVSSLTAEAEWMCLPQ